MHNVIGFVLLFMALLIVGYLVACRKMCLLDDEIQQLIDPNEEVPTETDMYPPEVTPVHTGLYKTSPIRVFGYVEMAKWDGAKWVYPDGDECYFQDRSWRGLTEQVTA